MKSRALFVVWIVIALMTGPALAQSADALRVAQNAFDEAQIAYLGGDYEKAATKFEDAYKARDFPQFLFNIGAAWHMKGKKESNADAYTKAVDYYKQYLVKDPQAADKEKVQKAIGVLEKAIAELKAAPPPAQGTPPTAPAATTAEVESLGDVKVRGLIVIESDPSNATIYLDDKRKGAFGTTPWSGPLEGEHKIIIEKRGYKVIEKTLAADPSKLMVFSAAMAQEDYLGWVEFTSNIPGSEIFIDDKAQGAIAKTPAQQNIKPGKHTFWITAEGYDEYKEEIEIIAGQSHTIKANLSGRPVGRLNVSGPGIEDATILLDGKVLCERGICVKNVQEGQHRLTVIREDYKPYTKTITIQAKTEMKIKVVLARKPSRSDAVVAYVVAGGFIGGGIFLGLKSNSIKDELETGIQNGTLDSNDNRFNQGKYYAIAADAAFAIGAISAITGLYYTFRDKGAPSTGLIEVNSIALRPAITPTYAGLGMEMRF